METLRVDHVGSLLRPEPPQLAGQLLRDRRLGHVGDLVARSGKAGDLLSEDERWRKLEAMMEVSRRVWQ